LRVVGIRYSAAGWLELIWKPEPTWNCSSTVLAFPRITVAMGGGDRVTDGACLPGKSCALSDAVDSKSINTIFAVEFNVYFWVCATEFAPRIFLMSSSISPRPFKPKALSTTLPLRSI
jgi:hypothetical protein